MARVSIVPPEKAVVVAASNLYSGDGEIRKYLDGKQDPIHVYMHFLARGAVLRIAPTISDCVAYVWHGGVSGGDSTLTGGSSVIVERGATFELVSTENDSRLVTFSASASSAKARAGGHVHLLSNERVPRFGNLATGSALSGGLHADAMCPTCAVWLHENSFAPPNADAPRADAEVGIHSHAEDEVIFVTAGQMRLGSQLYGPGTALAIAASTMYSFTTGPDGLSFINFRPGLPHDIRFKNGRSMDEVGYWRERVAVPQPISFVSH